MLQARRLGKELLVGVHSDDDILYIELDWTVLIIYSRGRSVSALVAPSSFILFTIHNSFLSQKLDVDDVHLHDVHL